MSSVSDFLDFPIDVTIGGRAFAVRPPTVATVHLALSVFSGEIVAAHESGSDQEAIRQALRRSFRGPRAGAVLATCVSTSGVSVADLVASDPKLAGEILDVVLSRCDEKRIAASVTFQNPSKASPVAIESPDPAAIAIDFVARRYVVTPMQIMAWPYEAFLTAGELYRYASEGPPPPMIDPENLPDYLKG